MPELPEVETLCRQLHESVAGAEIKSVSVYDKKLGGIEPLAGRTIRRVRRLGKTISISMDNGKSLTIHLRMTGRLFLHSQNTKPPHSRLRIRLDGRNIDLIDPRRFATVKVLPETVITSDNDLMESFSLRQFMERHARRKVSVKTLLMDARAFAGIGNIYACEILHAAGIAPEKRTDSLTPEQWKTVLRHARRILKKGIQNRGTSISDWRDLYGRPGENQNELKVYGRAGKKCLRCAGVIVRVKQAGRGTYCCPDCQK